VSVKVLQLQGHNQKSKTDPVPKIMKARRDKEGNLNLLYNKTSVNENVAAAKRNCEKQ